MVKITIMFTIRLRKWNMKGKAGWSNGLIIHIDNWHLKGVKIHKILGTGAFSYLIFSIHTGKWILSPIGYDTGNDKEFILMQKERQKSLKELLK